MRSNCAFSKNAWTRARVASYCSTMSSTAARIGVAALGLISALGHTLEAFQAKVMAGESAVGPWQLDLPGIDPVVLPLARCDFNDAAVRTPSRVPADRGTAMALTAAMAAWTASGLDMA